MGIQYSDVDREEIATAILMRICQIETGDTSVRAVDVAAMNEANEKPSGPVPRCFDPSKVRVKPKYEIKALTREQRNLITRLEDIMDSFRRAR